MGVKGLWRLLLPIGRRISIETLEGKVLAIDASIWLTQFLKVHSRINNEAGEDGGGGNNAAATGAGSAAPHLAGFFRRLCRLAYHNIRPVFVFDGVMPEIKRREIRARQRRRKEQFAKQSSVAVQRLAKKLLTEQLKQAQVKSSGKNNKTPGAFAEHFNQPEESDSNNATPRADQAVTAASKEEEGKKPESDANGDGGLLEGASVIDLTLTNNDDNHTNAAETQQKEEEWDRPLDTEQAGNVSEEENNEENSAFPTVGAVYDSNEHLTVDYISSLPSSKRKDAIEKAQRNLRIASRREFMPAAANAGQFSQVQLSNFLKSSHFNKSMEEMAKRVVSKDQHGRRGDIMASDRNTRIELIREDESEQNEGSERPKRIRKLRQKSSKSKANDVGDNSDSDGEELWLEDDSREDEGRVSTNLNGQPSSVAVARKSKRRIIQDDDDDGDDDDDDDDPHLDSAGGFFVQSSPAAKSPQALDNDSDDGGGGGFLKHNDTIDEGGGDDDEAGGGFLKQKPTKYPKGGGGAVNDDAFDVWGGGGFIPSKQAEDSIRSEVAQVARIDLTGPDDDDGDEVEMKGNNHTPFGTGGTWNAESATAEDRKVPAAGPAAERMDAECAQELADRVLAQALQEAEDADAVVMDDATRGLQQSEEGRDPTSILIERAHTNSHPNDLSAPSAPRGEVKEDVDSSDEDEVDWEEGEEENSSDKQLSPPPESRASIPDAKEMENPELGLGHERRASPSAQIRDQSGYDDSTSYGERVQSQSGEMGDETAEALERAQETASRLANWAGNVFRRAMKEVNHDPNVSPPLKRARADGNSNTSTNYSSEVPEDDRKPAARTEPFCRNERDNITASNTQAGVSASLDSVLKEQGNNLTFVEERNKRDGDMEGAVTDEMMSDIKQLLSLFGTPFIDAPSEAEAQCAALEALGLVDGIVTEDSDVFVFGGKAVYKNIFEEKHYVEAYLATDAEKEMSIGRDEMVALAMLLGGDYTEGVKGVGIVNAMEVLEAFDMTKGTKEGLKAFKNWLDGIDILDKMKSDSEEIRRFHEKHRSARTNWTYPENFPSDNVLNAYFKPVVDESTTRFSWGAPDVSRLLSFCNRTMGWRPEDSKSYLDPIMEKASDGYRQTRLDSFMRYEDSIKFADVRSKRLRDVLGLSSKNDSESSKDKKKAPRKKKRRTK